MRTFLVAAVTLTVVFGIFYFASKLIQQPTEPPVPNAEERATLEAIRTAVAGRETPTEVFEKLLFCPDCVATEMPANLWIDRDMSQKVCDLPWGMTVKVLLSYDDMVLVSGDSCEGWIRTSLLQ